MKRSKLDKIDLRILSDLQENGRMTNVDLAQNAGISAPPCLRRVRALEDNGYIEGYNAHVNKNYLGWTVTAYTSITLASAGDKDIQKFVETVDEWDQVRDCYTMIGDADFLLKIVARDFDDYQNFVQTNLTGIENIKTIKSNMIMKAIFKKPGVPIEVK